MQPEPFQCTAPPAPAIGYHEAPIAQLLDNPNVLAVLDFTRDPYARDDPRLLAVHLPAWQERRVREVWQASGPVVSGEHGAIRHARGGGWLLASICLPDDGHDVRATTARAYRALTEFLRTQPDFHVQRIWNYLDNINQGDGDTERYRQFCAGRLEGMGAYFADGFPAATAVGHAQASGHLQVYCLAAQVPGERIENPRQLSAWRYPRQYGPVSPSFARAMRLPCDDGLAISGTAAIQGHASLHEEDLDAQLHEILTNLRSLLAAGKMPGELGSRSPLKVYVRHQGQMAEVDAFLETHLPECPRLLLHADICRRELLVEIDGWHFG